MNKILIFTNILFISIIVYLVGAQSKKDESNETNTTAVKTKTITKNILIKDTVPCNELRIFYVNADRLYKEY